MRQEKTPQGYHIHSNGGGLVQNTCTIDSTVYVGPDAWVFGNAQVSGDARVSGNAQVSGDAWVFGNAQVSGDARVSGDAWMSSPLYVQGTKHALTNSRHGYITIGCREHTFAYWQGHYEAIGRAEHYTKEEIKQYNLFIQMFSKIGK